MARIRHIKPEFFTSETVATLPLRARLTWIGMWTHCDDYGRCRDSVKLIKAAIWPLEEVSLREVEADLNALENAGLIERYIVGGRHYVAVVNWLEHQYVPKPSKPKYPSPPDSDTTTAPLPDSAGSPTAPLREGYPQVQGTGDRGQGTGDMTRAAREHPTASTANGHQTRNGRVVLAPSTGSQRAAATIAWAEQYEREHPEGTR